LSKTLYVLYSQTILHTQGIPSSPLHETHLYAQDSASYANLCHQPMRATLLKPHTLPFAKIQAALCLSTYRDALDVLRLES
jgi:hypothetical protein